MLDPAPRTFGTHLRGTKRRRGGRDGTATHGTTGLGPPGPAASSARDPFLDPARTIGTDRADAEAFVAQVRAEMRAERRAGVEQGEWEERMRTNAVASPVPVRVDARMRPVTS